MFDSGSNFRIDGFPCGHFGSDALDVFFSDSCSGFCIVLGFLQYVSMNSVDVVFDLFIIFHVKLHFFTQSGFDSFQFFSHQLNRIFSVSEIIDGFIDFPILLRGD